MIEIEPDPELKQRFPAIGRMFILTAGEVRAKYPPGSGKPLLRPFDLLPPCSREEYEQACHEGVQARKDGKQRKDCPYDATKDRRARAWLLGWMPLKIPTAEIPFYPEGE